MKKETFQAKIDNNKMEFGKRYVFVVNFGVVKNYYFVCFQQES